MSENVSNLHKSACRTVRTTEVVAGIIFPVTQAKNPRITLDSSFPSS